MSSLPLPIAAFLAGLISFLSPCVLPLVPGYVSLISGLGIEELKRQDGRLRRTVIVNSLGFIAGFSLVFIALGAVAGGIGQFVGRHLDLLTRAGGVLIIIFGLHLSGLMPIRLLYADKRMHHIANRATAAGSFLMGFAFAFGWAPCAGPVLAAVLTLAASRATIYTGTGLLAVYSLGMALPFFLTALGIGRFLGFYGRFRPHLRKVEVVSGGLLIVVGVMVLTNHFALLNYWMNRISFFRSLAERFL